MASAPLAWIAFTLLMTSQIYVTCGTTSKSQRAVKVSKAAREAGLASLKLVKRAAPPPSWWYHTTGHTKRDHTPSHPGIPISRQSLAQRFIEEVIRFFSNNPVLEQRLMMRKKGPPPGWWYHTTGHTKRSSRTVGLGDRITVEPRSAERIEDSGAPGTSGKERLTHFLIEEFIMFLSLKDDGTLDECLSRVWNEQVLSAYTPKK